MKADSNSLIYIIISIVLLIISSIGKSKAKKTTPQHEPDEEPIPQSPWPRDLEDILGKMLEKEPEPVKRESSQEHWLDKESEVSPEPVIATTNQPEPPVLNVKDYSAEPAFSLAKQQEIETEYAFEFHAAEMRKAIIYSEIINRKYI